MTSEEQQVLILKGVLSDCSEAAQAHSKLITQFHLDYATSKFDECETAEYKIAVLIGLSLGAIEVAKMIESLED